MYTVCELPVTSYLVHCTRRPNMLVPVGSQKYMAETCRSFK